MRQHTPHFQRRDFLKLASALSLAHLGGRAVERLADRPRAMDGAPNFLILLFDAFSARNISLYGYQRETTPNIARFAQRATVYHAHTAGGNWTPAGTASLLTGVLPWTHRAFHPFGSVLRSFESRNIFHHFNGTGYTRMAYTHNGFAHIFLHQFRASIERLLPPQALAHFEAQVSDQLPAHDSNIITWAQTAATGWAGDTPAALFYPLLSDAAISQKWKDDLLKYKAEYPLGLPGLPQINFFLEDAMDWLQAQLPQLPQPYLAYVHLFPPHAPYSARSDYIGRFADGWSPADKPEHIFSGGHTPQKLHNFRQLYDEYVAFLDAEFGRLYDQLQSSGQLDHTYLILTSDHGEMFERGVSGHVTETLFEPVTRIPLVIAAPGQTARQDVYTRTSCVDILPTAAHLAGLPAPAWGEGVILPPFNPDPPDPQRSIFTVEAKENSKWKPLTRATVAMVKGQHKLIQYMGYEKMPEGIELFDLENDPEELENLADSQPALAAELRESLRRKLAEVDQPFQEG
jgi:arylsulfatase A-like enzyme